MSVLCATGGYLPERIVGNDELAALVNQMPGWIRDVSGIEQRRYAADSQSTTDLAVLAAENCLTRAGVRAAELGMLLVSSGSAERFCPGPASSVAARLGLSATPALDIPVASAGSLIGLAMAMRFAPSMGKVLVIGTEIMSRRVDRTPEGRNTAILFGDGAGAALLDSTSEPGSSGAAGSEAAGSEAAPVMGQGSLDARKGLAQARPEGAPPAKVGPAPLLPGWRLADVVLFTDGSGAEVLAMSGDRLSMDGGSVILRASRKLPAAITELLRRNGLAAGDVEQFVLHQANLNLLLKVAASLKVPADRVFTNIQRYGNTSSASLLIALDEYLGNGPVPSGPVVLSAFGAGLNWGALLLLPN